MQYTVYEKGSFYNWHTDGGTEFTIETSTGSQAWDNPKKIIDDKPIQKTDRYRVEVIQNNGERAWSSPIWVSN